MAMDNYEEELSEGYENQKKAVVRGICKTAKRRGFLFGICLSLFLVLGALCVLARLFTSIEFFDPWFFNLMLWLSLISGVGIVYLNLKKDDCECM